MRPVTIVKLGGSAITDKGKECTPNLALIHEAADQIASYNGKLILLHGAGSYGHPLAMNAKLNDGYRSRNQLQAISEIQLQLDELSRIIGVSLLLSKVPFVPIKPLSCFSLRKGRVLRSFLDPIASALRLGFIPLLHGDIVFDQVDGFGILSADAIASYLAQKFFITRVLFGSDVDGIHTKDPKKSRSAKLVTEINRTNYLHVAAELRRSSNLDASGGMYGKFAEAILLARRGCEVNIFNLKKPHALREMLTKTRFHGTRFVPWRVSRSK
jgi:isopentenyl phosphate kinase